MSASANQDEASWQGTGKTRRTSTVSIAAREGGEDHPQAETSLAPRLTPRGRRSAQEDSALPAPTDDIFKSSLWPSLPIGISSLENQITNVKLDLIMAFVQDVRLSLASGKPTSRASSRSARSETSVASSSRSSVPHQYIKFKIPTDDVESIETLTKTSTTLADITQPAIRLFMKDNTDASKHFRRGPKCSKDAGKFVELVTTLGENLSADDKALLAAYEDKDNVQLFLSAIKERVKIYDEENPSDEWDEAADGRTVAGKSTVTINVEVDGENSQDKGGDNDDYDDGNDEEVSSEPVRDARKAGQKSAPKAKGNTVTKKLKSGTNQTTTTTPSATATVTTATQTPSAATGTTGGGLGVPSGSSSRRISSGVATPATKKAGSRRGGGSGRGGAKS